MPQSGMQPQAGMNYMDPTMSPKAQTQSGMGYMDPPMSPQMQPQSGMGYMDPPMSPEMQQFMEQGYLMGPNCFGSDSQRYANLLMEYINDEYRDYMYYTTLSRRAPTASGRRVFRNISGDEMKHARRWASAYFLITGKRYFPTRTTVEPVNVPSNYSQALRERYMAESRDAVKYRQFAASTTDRCLKRMATDTSDDERQHAQDILTLIQNM
jgi:rubrerythrin